MSSSTSSKTAPEIAIEIKGLVKKYGEKFAVNGINLTVQQGEIFALLGPNGAGKTTTVEILEGFRNIDGGFVSVLNFDPATKGEAGRVWRNRIGIVLQSTTDAADLTVQETIEHFAHYYENPRDVNEVIDSVGLREKADDYARNLSGGQRRRLDVALGIIGSPELLFLDEPTTGLDPRGRQDMWGVIDDLVKGGVTLLLTTQYLEEADHLADEIAVIDHGKVIARGTSDSLKKQVGGERLEIVVENANVAATKEIVAKVSGTAVNVDEGLRQISAPVTTGSKALIEAAKMLDEAGIHPLDIGLKRPSLDDVFLSLTGHVAEEKIAEVSDATSGRKKGKK